MEKTCRRSVIGDGEHRCVHNHRIKNKPRSHEEHEGGTKVDDDQRRARGAPQSLFDAAPRSGDAKSRGSDCAPVRIDVWLTIRSSRLHIRAGSAGRPRRRTLRVLRSSVVAIFLRASPRPLRLCVHRRRLNDQITTSPTDPIHLTVAPRVRISLTARSESAASTPAIASPSTVTVKPADSASSTECRTQ